MTDNGQVTQVTDSRSNINWPGIVIAALIVLGIVGAVACVVHMLHQSERIGELALKAKTAEDAKTALAASKAEVDKRLDSLEELAKRAYGCKFEDQGKDGGVASSEPAAKPAPAKKTAAAAPSAEGNAFAVKTGEYYRPGSNFSVVESEAAAALETCGQELGRGLTLCIAEQKNQKRNGYAVTYGALAVAEDGLTAVEAESVAKCLRKNMPKIKQGDGLVSNGSMRTTRSWFKDDCAEAK